MRKKLFISPLVLLALLLNSVSAFADTGFVDINLYPYTHVPTDTAITVNAFVKLPKGFQYFSLNSFGRRKSASDINRFSLDSFVTEQNLRWNLPGDLPWNLFQLTVQALLRDGSGNDALRLGFRWKVHKTPLLRELMDYLYYRHWINFHGAQFDENPGYQWQISHNFRFDPFPESAPRRIYIKGWADHNINHEGGVDHTWIEEAQLGIRVVNEFHLVGEQRYNGFRRGKELSVGVGIQYILRF